MSGNSAIDFSVSTSPISPEIRLFSQSQAGARQGNHRCAQIGFRGSEIEHSEHENPTGTKKDAKRDHEN